MSRIETNSARNVPVNRTEAALKVIIKHIPDNNDYVLIAPIPRQHNAGIRTYRRICVADIMSSKLSGETYTSNGTPLTVAHIELRCCVPDWPTGALSSTNSKSHAEPAVRASENVSLRWETPEPPVRGGIFAMGLCESCWCDKAWC